jgi:hypothetical protein
MGACCCVYCWRRSPCRCSSWGCILCAGGFDARVELGDGSSCVCWKPVESGCTRKESGGPSGYREGARCYFSNVGSPFTTSSQMLIMQLMSRLYALLPPKPPQYLTSRTFIVLPKYQSRAKNHFVPTHNAIANNEIEGHTGMFSASTNDGYYQLGLLSANLIRDAVMVSRGPVQSASPVKTAGGRRRSSATQPTTFET